MYKVLCIEDGYEEDFDYAELHEAMKAIEESYKNYDSIELYKRIPFEVKISVELA